MRTPNRPLDEFEQALITSCQSITNKEPETWGFSSTQTDLSLESGRQADPARAIYRLTITPELCNLHETLHGGCAATLVDVLSTTLVLALSSPGHFQRGGVTRNLRLTYLRPVARGMRVRLVTEAVHLGRRLVLLRSEIRALPGDPGTEDDLQDGLDGILCVVAEHEKANTDPVVKL
ncbi:hypothetical protein ASPZODRAFT_2014601 [Penicilliopsis zonata CBS 506.65]|uniref:Thioesterase domain-containing protein n=1 Tax=Penicilliopsis zonata CBS 506.65 TaxID=1073090 RepID=A0A1L9SHY4_9EURO|nr:hypothetical protein ASPZODRAFT_2014601 [Penicilliopsis zonata CBS 506.65]OJJ46747.1 hypothetical protein ASPZODRAFT_2014601 [Penicilliopsis zonata CBS 506.65]